MTKEEAIRITKLSRHMETLERVARGELPSTSLNGLTEEATPLHRSTDAQVRQLGVQLTQGVEALLKRDQLIGKPRKDAIKRADKRLDKAAMLLYRLNAKGVREDGDRSNGSAFGSR